MIFKRANNELSIIRSNEFVNEAYSFAHKFMDFRLLQMRLSNSASFVFQPQNILKVTSKNLV